MPRDRFRWGRGPRGPWRLPFPNVDPRFAEGEGPHPFWAGPKDGPPFGPPFPFWGGPPFDDDGRGGPRRRQRRGDIKFALLELLAERPRHGYELIKELEQRFGGFYRPSPGSVYPTLQLLEDEGHLSASDVDGKKVYTVTESGRKLLEERRGEPGAEWHRGGPFARGPLAGSPELSELSDQTRALLAVVQQVARYGSAEQRRAAKEQLEATRRELYRLLAEGERGSEG